MGELLHSITDRTPLPREFVVAYCGTCKTEVQSTIGPATAAATRAAAHYTELAHAAEVLSALREACKVIEDSARDAFFRNGMSDHEFELAWRSEELQRWGHWTRLKTVAGLPHTQPEIVGCSDE